MDTNLSGRAVWRTSVLAAMPLVLGSTYSATAAAQTTLVDLGTLGGSQSFATGINDAGQVSGYSTLAGDTATRAFVYDNGVMTNLGTLGGDASYAYGINSSGQVVGASTAASGGVLNAFIYTNGVMQNIGPSTSVISYGYAINDSGSATGYLQPSLCSATCTAFLYSNGTLTDLGPQGLTPSIGFAITAAGAVVGSTTGTFSPHQGFVYNNGTIQYLTSGTSPQSQALGANNFGQVVGTISFTTAVGQPGEAALFSNGSAQVLGTLAGGTTSTARAINASGEIVGDGFLPNGADHAFLYASGHIADLNTLDTSSPLATYVTLTQATAINDNGWIVADGVDSRTGLQHAYLVENPASPVPLPGALWLMLSGICGLGAYARRRKGLSAAQ